MHVKVSCFSRRGRTQLHKKVTKDLSCHTGLSDHSGTIFPSIFAIQLGVKYIEVHLNCAMDLWHPDGAAAIDIQGLFQICKAVKLYPFLVDSDYNKDTVSNELISTKGLFQKYAMFKNNCPVGHVLTEQDMIFRKGCGEYTRPESSKLIGKILRKEVSKNTFITSKLFR